MKFYFPIVLLLFLIGSHHTRAQNYHAEDSALTTWLTDLARYSKLSCDSIKKIETDTAWKIVRPRVQENKFGKSIETGEAMYVLDDTSLLFMKRERISAELLK